VIRLFAGLVLALPAAPLLADIPVVPDRGDPRLGSARYSAGEPIRLQVQAGRALTVLLPPGEVLSSVSLGAPGDWQVDAGGGGGSFVVRPLRPVPDTNLALLAAQRTYSFVLSAAPADGLPEVVRIMAGPSVRSATAQDRMAAPAEATWKMSGRKELRPSSLRDDGSKTYIEWPADSPLPGVFALDRLGREEMVNGYMRGTVFTIDRVYDALVFRIDKASATARRSFERRRR